MKISLWARKKEQRDYNKMPGKFGIRASLSYPFWRTAGFVARICAQPCMQHKSHCHPDTAAGPTDSQGSAGRVGCVMQKTRQRRDNGQHGGNHGGQVHPRFSERQFRTWQIAQRTSDRAARAEAFLGEDMGDRTETLY